MSEKLSVFFRKWRQNFTYQREFRVPEKTRQTMYI